MSRWSVGVVGLMLFALPAHGADLPIRWSLAEDAGQVVLEIETLHDIEQFEVMILQSGTGSNELLGRMARGAVREGERLRVLGVRGRADADLEVRASGHVAGERLTLTATVPGQAAPASPVTLGLDASVWDEEAPRLRLLPSPDVDRIVVVVTGEDGTTLLTREHRGEDVHGGVLDVTWDTTAVRPLLIRAEAHASDGRYVWQELVPWRHDVVVDDVHFASGSHELPSDSAERVAEVARDLREMTDRVSPYVDIQLWVGGYTDTVGSAGTNRRLSLERARSLALALRREGLDVPIHVRGFGQEVLAVSTDDEVDEPRNRRAIFVLSAEPPAGRDFPEGRWERLR